MKTEIKHSLLDRVERNFIALLLGCMTMITFLNVVIRKLQEFDFWRDDWFAPIGQVFSNFGLQSLEMTVFLFAWLVIIGVSETVHTKSQLGVDAVITLLSPKVKRICAFAAVTACVIYSLLLLKGSWDYWGPFVNLPATTGRWFPTGFVEKFQGRGFYEVNDIFMPSSLQFLADIFNDGERYEKIPRFLPYFALPLGMSLLLYNYIRQGIAVAQGRADAIIASHEVEQAIEDIKHADYQE